LVLALNGGVVKENIGEHATCGTYGVAAHFHFIRSEGFKKKKKGGGYRAKEFSDHPPLFR